jgi:hypothetical protein
MTGATDNNDFFEVQPNLAFGSDDNPSTLSYASGPAADALGLSQATRAQLSSPGGQHPSVPQFMHNVLLEHDQFGNPVHFGSFQTTDPRLETQLQAWALSQPGIDYEFLTTLASTRPAGFSTPVTDPAGSWSNAGASAPTWGTPPVSSVNWNIGHG